LENFPEAEQTNLTSNIMEKTNMIITKRQRTHGVYKEQSAYSQTLKEILRQGKNWDILNDGQKEALEMIAVKIARVLNGDHNFRDHWDDIVGYGQLGTESCLVNMPTVTMDLEEAMKNDGQ